MSLAKLQSSSLFTLLHPRQHLVFVLTSFSLAFIVWAFLLGQGRLSLSSSSLIGLGLISVPIGFKLFDDAKRWGPKACILSSLIIFQGLHTLEHFAQVFQYYVLGWTASSALGLIAKANLEWLHFSWNWLIWLGVVF